MGALVAIKKHPDWSLFPFLRSGGSVETSMMAVIALSFPVMVILRKVFKPRLIATFVAVVSGGILLVGHIFNVVL